MKIAFSSYSCLNDVSGVNIWLLRITKYLIKYRFKVFVLLLKMSNEKQKTDLFSQLKKTGANVKEVIRQDSFEKNETNIIKFLLRNKPNIFLPQCLNEAYSAASICGKLGLPWIMVVHSDDKQYFSQLKKYEPENNNGKIITVSKYLSKKILKSKLGTNIDVIPCGSEKSKQKTKWNKHKFKILFLGRLKEEQKRISLVLQTFIKAVQSNKKIFCSFIGEGPEKEHLGDLIKKFGATENIFLKCSQTRAQIKKELLKTQSIILMSDYEGLPVSLLEGMSRGVVPCAKKIPSGIPELIIHNKTGLILNKDPKKAGVQIAALSKNQKKWQQLSINTKNKFCTEFEEGKLFKKYIKILKKLARSENITANKIPISYEVIKVLRGFKAIVFWRLYRLFKKVYYYYRKLYSIRQNK